MRTQECREKIDKAAEMCGIEDRYVKEVKEATTFADKYNSMLYCSTRAIQAIMSLRDKKIQEIAISTIEKAQIQQKLGHSERRVSFTEKQVRAFIKRAELQVKTERQKALDEERQKAEDLKAKAAAKVAETKVEDPVFLKLKKLSEDLAAVTAQCEINKKRLAIADETVEIHIEELRKAEQKVKDAKAHRDGVQREVDIDEKNIAHYVEQMNKLKDGV